MTCDITGEISTLTQHVCRRGKVESRMSIDYSTHLQTFVKDAENFGEILIGWGLGRACF